MIFKIKATVKVKKKKSCTGKPFNPLTYDAGNLIALYNGDIGLSNILWEDQSPNNYDLTLFNLPTVVPNAINGHQAIQFNGINQYGSRAITPVLNQPITIYIVFKQITWTIDDSILDSASGNTIRLRQVSVTPEIRQLSSLNGLPTNPNIPLNTYDILTSIFNGVNSELRTNNNVSVVSNPGNLGGTGITIAAYGGGIVNFSNIEIAYLIYRKVADNTATQNLFINYLKNRFAL